MLLCQRKKQSEKLGPGKHADTHRKQMKRRKMSSFVFLILTALLLLLHRAAFLFATEIDKMSRKRNNNNKYQIIRRFLVHMMNSNRQQLSNVKSSFRQRHFFLSPLHILSFATRLTEGEIFAEIDIHTHLFLLP